MGKLLIVPMLTYGHFNCCINICRLLLEYHPEHEVFFLVSDKWAEKLEKWEPRFKSLVYCSDEDAWKRNKLNEEEAPQGEDKPLKNGEKESGEADPVKNGVKENEEDDSLAAIVNKIGHEWEKPTIEKVKAFGDLMTAQLETIYDYRDKIEQFVKELKPDLIAFEHVIMVPFLLDAAPYIQIQTINPLFIHDHPSLPPYSSGYSADKAAAFEQWKEFRLATLKHTADYRDLLNSRLIEAGHACVRPLSMINESPYFNIYFYPKEICYWSMDPKIKLPGRWLRMDSSFLPTKSIQMFDPNDRKARFKRVQELYDVPDDFLQPDTKLIFFSLGTIASAYRKLMNRLIDLIGKVPPPFKFIVSKGPGPQITIPKNCVGKEFVDQVATLSCCDLMISHGGNNTLTEVFHLGVKLIIMPLFSDQPDNAQRLVDTNLGYRLDPFKCTQEQLNQTITEALNNDELSRRMQEISKRIQTDNGMNAVVKELHNLISGKIENL